MNVRDLINELLELDLDSVVSILVDSDQDQLDTGDISVTETLFRGVRIVQLEIHADDDEKVIISKDEFETLEDHSKEWQALE